METTRSTTAPIRWRPKAYQALLASFILLLNAAPAGAALLNCPECTNLVSEAATACPKCGAPIALIKQAALPTEPLKTNLPKHRRNCAVLLQSDTATGFGIAAEHDRQRFVIFDQRLIEGAESLTISPTTTNTPVNYHALELAADGSLARLTTESTNIVYLHLAQTAPVQTLHALAISALPSGDTVIHEADPVPHPDGTMALSNNLPRLICLCDLGTNIIAVAQPGSKLASTVSAVTSWVPVLPGDFRKQTRLLAEAETRLAATGPPDRATLMRLRTNLQAIQWLTAHLRARASALIRTIDTRTQ